MARLIGAINAEDVALLRAVKKLRNHVAHAVEIDLESDAIAEGLLAVYKQYKPVYQIISLILELARAGTPLFSKEFEKLYPDKWREIQASLDKSKPQWQEAIKSITAFYETRGMKPPETPFTSIMSFGIEHLLSSKTEIKAATILFLPNILSYYKIRFDLIIQNTKQVDSPAEQFNLLSAFVAGVPAGTKE